MARWAAPCRALGGALCLLLALAGCGSLPARTDAPDSRALDAAREAPATPLGRLVAASRPPGTDAGQSGLRLLSDPGYALEARLALAARATRTIDVQYYLLEPDATGLRFLAALRDAARRGVRVRLLLDDLYAGRDDTLLAALAAEPGLALRLFNPLPARNGGLGWRVLRSAHELARINRRMHNKLFVVDNTLSVAGGRNMADEYFMRHAQANFIDLDLLAAGPVVQAQSAAFDRYWNSAQVYPFAQVGRPRRDSASVAAPALADVEPPALRERDLQGRAPVGQELAQGRLGLIWAPAQLFVDEPGKIATSGFLARFEGSVSQRTLAVIRSARNEVLISSPYFIPGEVGLSIMRQAAQDGVRTTVVTNSLAATDEPLASMGYARYRPQMLALGVTLYEVAPDLARGRLVNHGESTGRLHAKMALVDQRWLYVGSMNLDGRSAGFNTESGLLVDSPALAQEFGKVLQSDRFGSAWRVRRGEDGRLEWVEPLPGGGERVHRDEPDPPGWLAAIGHWLGALLVDEELL